MAAAFGTPGGVGYVNPFAPQPPANTYNGPINDKITPAQGAALVNANQAQAAAMGVNIPGASEPAVISSTKISDQVIPDAQKKLADMSQKGNVVGADGNAYHADGSMAAAPEGSTYDEATGSYKATDGKTYGAAEFYGTNGGPQDQDWQAVQAQFAPLKAQLDAATLGVVNSIHQQFDALRAQQSEFNAASESARQRVLLTSGTSRYAPLDASGITLAQTSYGLQKIADLNAQENTAISNAQQAAATNNMKLMSDQMGIAEDIRKQKQTEAQKISEQISTTNQKLADMKLQAARGGAIADLVTQGIHDPAELLKHLNENTDGSQNGNNFSANEIATTLKSLTVAGTDPKDISTDLSTFNYIKEHVGLPKDIASLPPQDQYFAYLQAIKGAAKVGGTTGTGAGGSSVPTWEEYKTAAQTASGVNYFMAPEEAQLREQYDAQYGQYAGGAKPEKFTPTELKKLEQAGLLNTTRQKQLDYLYKKSTDTSTADLPSALQ